MPSYIRDGCNLTQFLSFSKKIFFQFDDKQFKQLHGTAIGTKMAPTYATLGKRLQELIMFRRKQHYPVGLIHKGTEKAQKISVTEVRSPKEEN